MSANIKTWQERMEGGSYLGMGCYVSGTDTVKTGYTGVRAQIAARDAEIADLRAALAAKAVPDGWKLVPVEPTEEMLYEALKVDDKAYADGSQHGASIGECWDAMRAAAPTPAEQEKP